MHIRRYRAKTMQEALALVRRDLGPTASVLRTREVRRGLPWLGPRVIEVLASASIDVPSRLPATRRSRSAPPLRTDAGKPSPPPRMPRQSPAPVEPVGNEPARSSQTPGPTTELPDVLYRVFTDLIDAEVPEELAREWLERLRCELGPVALMTPDSLKRQLADWIADDLQVAGPIGCQPNRRRLVALVGPTGVGKTTTIAKLAGNFRLREKRSVGLITVDTYRIAAVEQLRTYADIIDLPMEIVSTPREMQQAVARMAHLDLVLMDTAGRSPRDQVQLQELKSMLAQACPDEIHLVLSSVVGATALCKTAAQFVSVGPTALLLTKLDEAMALGNLLPFLRKCDLPLSYLTNGQNVPDDIQVADARRLAHTALGISQNGAN